MKSIEDFNLSKSNGRYQARKHGFCVPKQSPGCKPHEFWSMVDKKSESECWNWLGVVNQWGYGRYNNKGTHMAHRYAYELEHGKSIKGFVAMHKCDNPRCCNVKHLEIGTHADNQHDKVKKNRHAKGEKQGMSILTENQVKEAREKYKPRVVTYKMLAKEYGVCKDTIQKAVRGILWGHI
jgi:hypothetical protein